MTFEEIARLVGGLPPSASVHPAWWSNSRSHVEAAAELAAVPLWLPANLALVLVVLGVLPNLEPALYLAAVVLILLMDALILLLLVNRVWRPATT
jgi:hypothetical protein